MDSLPLPGGVEKSLAAEAADRLRWFRSELYGCLGRRADELFELTDAVLCADGPVRSLVGLCLTPEHRRGDGALYDGLNCGTVDADRLRDRLAGLPVPRMCGGRIVLAVDASPWLRPDAETCPQRLFCHVYGRGRACDQRIPGWPYQLVVALESGPSSWTAALEVCRLAFLLADLPLHLVGRLRSDRVMLGPAPARWGDGVSPVGRPRRPGAGVSP